MSKTNKFESQNNFDSLDNAKDLNVIDLEFDDVLKELESFDSEPNKDGLIVNKTVDETREDFRKRTAAIEQAEDIIQDLQEKIASAESNDEIEILKKASQRLESKLAQINKSFELHLPVTNKPVRTKFAIVDPNLCDVHPLNTRVLTDHNRVTLASRMASFKRQGQQEPALVTPTVDGRYLVIDGAGRLKTWKLLREDRPGVYDGDVFYVRIAEIPDDDVSTLSKTRNESEIMSDWNLAVMYQKLLNEKVYPDLKALCEAEGLNYNSWAKKIKLANIPQEYVGIFVQSAHIPSTFASKVTSWEKVIKDNQSAKDGLLKILQDLTKSTKAFLNGKGDAPYPIESGNANALLKQIQDYVNQFKVFKTVPKEKPIDIEGKYITGTAKKDRNGKFFIKLDKCDDATFQKVLANIHELATGSK